MNIFTRVTLKTLIKNKVRTIVTIIGIVLSAAMVTAVTTSVSSFQKYLQDVMISTDGLWHAAFYSMEPEDAALLAGDPQVESVAFAGVEGYARLPGVDALNDNTVPYLYILSGDETYYDRIPIEVTEGRLPENPGEILLSENAIFGGVFPEHEELPLGSEITLELGSRLDDGEELGRFDMLSPESERFSPRVTRTYTLVGYCSRPTVENYENPAYICFTVPDPSDPAPAYDGYCLLQDPADTFDFQQSFAGGKYDSTDNRDYLMTLGTVRYASFYRVLWGLAAILIALIMFGSVSLIYNAFSISVAERTKQYGLLRSVGATKRQLRHMVYREAAILSAVGIPLGVLSGILGMTITFHFIGDTLGESLYDRSSAVLSMHPTLTAVLLAAAIGFVTVLISAWIPSRRATKITAIEAIRQSADISIKPREVKVSPLTYKFFGIEGAIASKHFKRNRRRYRATVMSLFLSVVLFISASSFCRYLVDSASGVFVPRDYEIRYSPLLSTSDGEETDIRPAMEDVLQALRGAESVKEGTLIRSVNVSVDGLTADALSDEFLGDLGGAMEPNSDGEMVYDNVYPRIAGLDERSFAAYCREIGVDAEDYIGTGKVICCATFGFFNEQSQRVETVNILRDDLEEFSFGCADKEKVEEFYSRTDIDDLTPEEFGEEYDRCCMTHHTVPVGCVAAERPMGLKYSGSLEMYIIMPMDTFLGIASEYDENIYFTTGDHEAAYDSMMDILEDNHYPTGGLDDVYSLDESSRNIVMVVEVISYGFITLISLISAANVFNTISTNVLMRRREFAMLRSVGMTRRGLNKMMNFECLLYGTKSLIFGIPVAFAVTYLIFLSVSQGYEIGFYLPWGAVAIAVGSVFLVVFATMMYSMSAVKRDNPIDALKSEVT